MEAGKQGNEAQDNTSNPEVLKKADWLVAMAIAGELQFTMMDLARTTRRKFSNLEMLRALAATMILTESSPEERAAVMRDAEAELAALVDSSKVLKAQTGTTPKIEFDARAIFGGDKKPEDCGCPICTMGRALERRMGKTEAASASVTINGAPQVFKPSVVPFAVLGQAAGVVNPRVVVARGGQKLEVPSHMAVALMNGDVVEVTPAPPVPAPTAA